MQYDAINRINHSNLDFWVGWTVGCFTWVIPPWSCYQQAGWNHQWSMETNNSWVCFSINSHHPWVGKAEKWHGRRLSTEPSSDHDPARRISLRTQAVQAAGAGKDDRQCNGVPLRGSPRNHAEVSMLNVCVADNLILDGLSGGFKETPSAKRSKRAKWIRPTGVHTPSAQVPGRVQNFHWAWSLKARWILMIWRIIYCYNSLWSRFHVFFIISTWTALEMFSLCSFHAPSYADISWLLQYKIPPWNQGLVLDLFTVFHCWITMMKDIYGYITSTMGWFQEMGLPTKQPLQLRDFATGFQVVQLLYT